MPEVIVTTRKDGGEEIVSVYDAGFELLRRGRLRAEAHVTAGGEWQASTLSFPYLVREGGNNPSARGVLRRVDLESGADELVFTGDTGRGPNGVVAHPAVGGYFFAYNQRIGPGGSEGSAVTELWSASPDAAERIRFEDSYLAVMSDAETDERENPDGFSPLAGVRPLAVTPDGRYLLFARNRLYVLELASGKVEQIGSRYRATHARVSPDGTRVAVTFQDPRGPDPIPGRLLPGHLAVVELGSGRASEVELPAPLAVVGGDWYPTSPVWHPDGKHLACTAWVELYLPTPEGGPHGALAGRYDAAFIADPDTGETRAIARDPSVPSTPPPAEDFRIPQDYRSHRPVGFSRDGRTLFLRESYAVLNPAPTTPTSEVLEEDPQPTPQYVLAGEVVAVDVDANRREGVLTGADEALLLHR